MAKYSCPYCKNGFVHTSGVIPNPNEWLFISCKDYDEQNRIIDSNLLYEKMNSFFECVNSNCNGIAIFWKGFNVNPKWYISEQ